MTLPAFYAILDHDVARAHGWTVLALARACLTGGARLLQIRAKGMGGAALLELCEQISPEVASAGATLVVNDRADVARLVPGAGVHVGQEDLPPALARRLVEPRAVVGFSTHTPDQITEAVRLPISYLAVGPVFGTGTKDTGYGAVGVDLVRQGACAAAEAASPGIAPIPVVAIGGITLARARSARDAGASCVAVISDIFTGGDPEARVAAFIAELGA